MLCQHLKITQKGHNLSASTSFEIEEIDGQSLKSTIFRLSYPKTRKRF
jgi:hypothetical protein